MKRFTNARNRGFTLIEILVVMSIIGVLSSIITVSLNSARDKARDASRISQIHEIQSALDMYFVNHGSYPSNSYPLTFDDNIPHNWAAMIAALNSENLIRASFSLADKRDPWYLLFTSVAHAAMAVATYYSCSLQDPLYKSASDYQYSYAYTASSDGHSYKIRVYLEGLTNPLFQNSMEGTFYYCTGRQ